MLVTHYENHRLVYIPYSTNKVKFLLFVLLVWGGDALTMSYHITISNKQSKLFNFVIQNLSLMFFIYNNFTPTFV
jgi:hypothetical protein